jgi:hypothetical protein
LPDDIALKCKVIYIGYLSTVEEQKKNLADLKEQQEKIDAVFREKQKRAKNSQERIDNALSCVQLIPSRQERIAVYIPWNTLANLNAVLKNTEK